MVQIKGGNKCGVVWCGKEKRNVFNIISKRPHWPTLWVMD